MMPISSVNSAVHKTAPASDRECCSVNFCARPTPFLKTTYQKAREFYADYKKSLGETSVQEVISTADRIVSDTGHSRTEVLGAMQTVTQFANMRSIKKVAETMEKDKISFIGNCGFKALASICSNHFNSGEACKELNDFVFDNTGMHNMMHYLIDHKGFGVIGFEQMNNAIFLDRKKLKQLEALKKAKPKTFEKLKKIPNLKFYMISGWDTGINFINRSKNLEDETKKLLALSDKLKMPPEKAIDYSMMQRVSELGIKPHIIRREGVATETCVYNQMRPEQMSLNEMFNVLDANSQIRGVTDIDRFEAKETGIDFLKNYMKIYTPETLSLSLKNLHEKITEHAIAKGYGPKDLLFVERTPEKSYTLVDYAYKEVNKIPDSQITDTTTLKVHGSLARNKMLVFLDDCTISGDSIKSDVFDLKYIVPPGVPTLFACVCGTEQAVKKFSGKRNSSLIIGDTIKSFPPSKFYRGKNLIMKQVGEAEYSNGGETCVLFPYMAPDNNIGLGANIAVYHNVNYRTDTKQGRVSVKGTKNMSGKNGKIAVLSHDLTAHEPEVVEGDLTSMKKSQAKSLKEKVKNLISFFWD